MNNIEEKKEEEKKEGVPELKKATLVCGECGSKKVEVAWWKDANTYDFHEEIYGIMPYCLKCEKHVYLKSVYM